VILSFLGSPAAGLVSCCGAAKVASGGAVFRLRAEFLFARQKETKNRLRGFAPKNPFESRD